MVRERERVSSLLAGKPVRVDWAEVEERLEEDDLVNILGEYHGIICGDDRITARVLDAAPMLEVIVKWGTGVDSIDQEEAGRRKIPVRRTPNAFSEPVADTALALMLAFGRSIFASDRIMKQGGWDKPQGFCLSEKTVGIIGLGDSGTAVARRLASFGARVIANDTAQKDPELVESLKVRMVDKEELYRLADIITLHCDLNPTSFRLLDRAAFAKMTRRPYLINVARGQLIEERALEEALTEGKIAGAGLDVYEEEPLAKDSPLRRMDNVILSSHNANSSRLYWQRVHENSVRMLMEGLGID